MAFPKFRIEEKEEVGIIQGRRAASLPEWRVAKALWKIKVPFRYQVSFFGGRRLKGGQVVDFVVTQPPTDDLVFVDGEYWHGSASQRERDAFKRLMLQSKLAGRINWPPIVWTGGDLATQDQADRLVLNAFGGGG